MRDHKFPPLTVSVDGKQVFARAPALAIVAKRCPSTAWDSLFLPDARPDDRRLDVCVMPCSDRKALFEIAMLAAAGEHIAMDGVVMAGGSASTSCRPRKCRFNSMVTPSVTTPLHIELLDRRVGFIVP